MHPLIPRSSCVVIVCADEGAGKSGLLAQVAAAKTRAGKKVVYIYGEGSPEKNYELMVAAGADMALMVMVDCIVEHPDVQLDGMLRHDAIAKHLPGADTILIDTHSNFTSEGVRRHTIRRLLAPFHALARKGVTTYLAMHPNRYRNVRKAADVVPAGWAGSAEIVWQIEVDDQGHGVLEMTRGREYPKPWVRYEFWQGSNADGVRLAVIGAELPASSPLSIMHFLREKNPRHVPPSVAAAKTWLLDYLAEHGPSLVETVIFPAGKAVGHSEPALVKAKAISKDEIGHTPQGTGPSQWFLIKPDDSVDSVSDKGNEQNQQSQAPESDQFVTVAVEGKKVRRVRVPLSEAHAFTDKHHRHLDAARSNAKFAVGLKNETDELLAVIVAGRPSDCKTAQDAVLELSRVVTKGDRDDPNAASILIAAAVRFAVALGCERVQTFTLPHEDGTTYRACGFVPDGFTKPTGRPDDPVPRKQRWVKVLPPQWHTLKKASRGKACQPHPLPPTETMLQGELFKLAAG